MPELPLVGDEFAGYRLRSELGRGGMSVVYEAENPRLGNVIALKVLAPELANDNLFRTRFLEESRIAAAMNHPNVIPIHDTGSSNGLLYIAMRCVSGTDLRQVLKKRERLEAGTAIFLLSQAARALDAAHRRGLVHRDVKPANLLIERGNDDADPDHLYLADFGITKPVTERTGSGLHGPRPTTGQVIGTVDYVAPEQIRGISVLGMADQYSLGCVLYECLTGRVPFEKDLNEAIIWAHVEEYPTRPTLLRPDLPLKVDGVFAQVLAKQPGDRYANCREFITAARDALATMAARPPTAGSLAGSRRAPRPAGYLEVAHDRGAGMYDLTTGVARPGQRHLESPVSRPEPGIDATAEPLPGAVPYAGGPRHIDSLPPPGGAESAGGPGGRQPAGDRWRRRPGAALLALIAAMVIAPGAVIGGWAAFSHGTTSNPRTGASMPAGAPAGALAPPVLQPVKPRTLLQALRVVNTTPGSADFLPPADCTMLTTVDAKCSGPYPGISQAYFQMYPSLTALYAAYQAEIKQVNNGQFPVNVQDCGSSAPPPGGAELSWNHFAQHTRAYSIKQLETGSLNGASQAAGRMFCSYSSSTNTTTIVWTETDGRMLGVVNGSPHHIVWIWWMGVHHNVAFSDDQMGNPARKPMKM